MADSSVSSQAAETRQSLALPAVFTVLGVALLCALGFWQLERKAWKEGLLAEIAERTSAPAVPFPAEAQWPSLSPAADEYRHVRLEGRFLNDKQAHLQANLVSSGDDEGALGYDILSPLRQADGSLVIVNRGFVPLDKKDPSSRPGSEVEGPTTVEGLIRFPQDRPWFAPADDPAKNVWFSRDPVPIAAAYGLERVAPVIVDADRGVDPSALPRGGQTLVSLPNNHLQYAITWFALAAALIGVFVSYALPRLRQRDRPGT